MAEQTRSSVFATIKENQEGKLEQVTSSNQFSVLREGFSFQSNVETVESDELVNDIGATKTFLSKETPQGTIPKYFKHSGQEGVEPSWGPMLESCMGLVTVNGVERQTVAGSIAGDEQTRAIIKVGVGEGLNFKVGQALLIKDQSNRFHIRNIFEITGDDLTLNFNLPIAPGSSVSLGKAIHYQTQANGHPTYSAHLYQAVQSSAYHQAMAGCRTTNAEMSFPANDLTEINFEFGGIEFFYNPIVIDSSNNQLDFEDSGTNVVVATMESKTYKTPIELAREIESKMNGAQQAGDTIKVSFNSISGKFKISSDGALELLWSTGANSGNSIGQSIGFSVVSDDTGASEYEGDNELSYDPTLSPTFDDNDPVLVRGSELLLGDFFRTDCRDGKNFSVTVSTPKTDVDNWCADSGVSESVILEREVTFSATLYLKKHEVSDFDTFLNNQETSLMFNTGPKSGGDFIAGKSINLWIPQASITTNVVADEDGIQVVNLEATGFVSANQKDIHINLL